MKNKELLHLSCAQELHIENKTEDTIGYKEFKCLATCLMEHRGYLKHGEVDVHEVAKAIKEKTHLEKHLKSKLIADLPNCAKYIKHKKHCDKAIGFSNCLVIFTAYRKGQLDKPQLEHEE